MADKQPDMRDEALKGTPAVMPEYPSVLPTLNIDEYRDDLAGLHLNEAQEKELLQTLWNIMAAFVDLGWGVDGVQLFLPELFETVAQDSGKLLDSKNHHKGD